MFAQGDYEDKKILMGSLFTKKVELGKNSCRTTQLNEVVEVLARFSKGCGGSKKRKAIISDSFSAIVHEQLHLSNFLTDFQAIKILMNSNY